MADRVEPDPGRDHGRGERAEDPGVRPAPVPQRQKDHLELGRGAFLGRRAKTGDDAGRFLDDGLDRMVHILGRVRMPEPIERLALELAAEEGADAGSGEPDRRGALGRDLEDEGVGEDVPDLAGLDLAALGALRSPRSASQ